MVIQPRKGELTVYPLIIDKLIYILQVKRRKRWLISTRILQIYFESVVLALIQEKHRQWQTCRSAYIRGTPHTVCYVFLIHHPTYSRRVRSIGIPFDENRRRREGRRVREEPKEKSTLMAGSSMPSDTAA
jgi:hypothetical protein